MLKDLNEKITIYESNLVKNEWGEIEQKWQGGREIWASVKKVVLPKSMEYVPWIAPRSEPRASMGVYVKMKYEDWVDRLGKFTWGEEAHQAKAWYPLHPVRMDLAKKSGKWCGFYACSGEENYVFRQGQKGL